MSRGGNIWVILGAVACWFVGMGLYSWYYSRHGNKRKNN